MSIPYAIIYAQSPLDSLLTTYYQAEDSTKRIVLREIILFHYQDNPDSALHYVYEMKNLFEKTGDTIAYLDYKSLEAEYYWRKSDYQTAMEHALLALKVAELSPRYSTRLGSILITLGNVHLYLLNTDDAIHYYRRAAANFAERGRYHSVASIQNNTGVVWMDAYESQKKPELLDSAILYFKKVIAAGDVARHNTRLNSMGNLGYVYFLQNKLGESLEMFTQWQALELSEPNKTARAMNLGNYGKLMLALNQPNEAIRILSKGLQDAKELEASHEVQEYYGSLSHAYASLGAYQKAYEFSMKYQTLKDSVFLAEKAQTVADLNTKYQTEQKQQQITQLEQANRIKDLEATRARQWRLYLIVIVVLLLITAVVFYSRYQLKRRSEQILDEKNQQLEAINDYKNKLFAIISHDLKSPLASFSSITSTLYEYFDHMKAEDARLYLNKLSLSARSIEGQMKNLLEWAMNQLAERKLTYERLQLRPFLEEFRIFFQLNIDIKKQELYIEAEDTHGINTDKEYLQTILRNLLSNAIKFTPTGGSIRIIAHEKEDYHELQVRDSGIGIETEDIEKLFNLTEDKKSIGTSSEKGTGLGLVLVKEMIERLSGRIEVASEPGIGTTFTVVLPKVSQSFA